MNLMLCTKGPGYAKVTVEEDHFEDLMSVLSGRIHPRSDFGKFVGQDGSDIWVRYSDITMVERER